MSPPKRHPLFAVCAPGLEPLLLSEIEGLGVRGPRPRTGGVSFEATTRQMYAANLSSRIATRVVERVTRFPARSFKDLEDEVRLIDWARWLDPSTQVDVRATSTGSQLYHTGAVVERFQRFVGERASSLAASQAVVSEGGAPRQLIIVRIIHDEVTISIDTSGEPLYKRGWRQEIAKAPLRETFAAAMLISAGWDGSTSLIDPMCGSGTIAIEAALMARGVPPGFDRSFAFSDWPCFEPGTWASLAGIAKTKVKGLSDPDSAPSGRIVARDRDAGAVATTERNAERALVRSDIAIGRAAISELTPAAKFDEAPGWIIANPPYGARARGGADLRDLYARFGDVVRGSFEGWSVGLLVADPKLASQTRLAFEELWRAKNGGIPVHFLTATV